VGESTGIEFASGTANTHIGCARIGAGCGNRHLPNLDWGDPALNELFRKYGGKCWAMLLAERRSLNVFGVGLERHEYDRETLMNTVLKIDYRRQHGETFPPTPTGEYVCFAVDLGDFFDHETPRELRDWWWDLIRITPHIRWLLISKRLHNVITLNMLPEGWPVGYEHVTIMCTVAIQAELERNVDALVSFPAMCRGIILEPMLQRIDISYALKRDIDWLIVGGESGDRYDDDPEIAKTESPEGKAAPFDISWVPPLKQAWVGAGRAFFFKQAGSFPFDHGVRLKLSHHGGVLDELPRGLRHRKWPAQMIEPLAKLRRRAFKAGIVVPD